MKRALTLALLTCTRSLLADAIEAQPRPPSPSPMIPSRAERASPVPTAAPISQQHRGTGQVTAKTGRRKPGRPTIRLGEKHETDHPEWHGAGVIRPGKIEVKSSGGSLRAVLTGAADSHAFLGVHSESLASIQLVQEFEIVPGAPEDPRVTLSLSGSLDGYVRSEHKSAASLRHADAVVYPVSGGPSVSLGFPSCCTSNQSATRCKSEFTAPSVIVPSGKYVLVINLVLETTADGFFRGHSVAVFTPGFNPGFWRSEADELEDLEEGDFGLAVILKITPPGSD